MPVLKARISGQWVDLNLSGPAGPPGPSIPSADANNSIKLGSDSLLYEKQLAYVVAKSTAPTAADYGLPSIPVGAVWVQTP